MTRWVIAFFFLGSWVVAFGGSASAAEKVVSEGMAAIVGGDVASAREAALRGAQRAAIEQVVGTVIASEFSAVQKESIKAGKSDFSSVVEDKVTSLAQGFVRRFDVVSERQEGQTYRVSIRAEVDRDSLSQQLQNLDKLMRDAGYPKTMVLVAERYKGQDKKQAWLDKPTAPALLEKGLLDKGLPLVAADKVGSLRGSSQDSFGQLVLDSGKAAQLAHEQGAEIAVVGLSDIVWSAYDVSNDKLHYVAVTLGLRAVRGRTGQILASLELTGRGVGVSEDSARQNAAKAVATKAIENILEQVSRSWSAEVGRGTAQKIHKQLTPKLGLVSSLAEARLDGGGKAKVLGPAREIVFEAQGPLVVDLEFMVLGDAAPFVGKHGELVATRLGAAVSRWPFAAQVNKAKKAPRLGERGLSAPLHRHLEVPTGTHRYRLTFGVEVVASLEVARAVAKPLAMPAEQLLPPPVPVTVEAVTVSTKEVTQESTPAGASPGAPPFSSTAAVAHTGSADAARASPGEGPAAPSRPGESPITPVTHDGSVGGATAALAHDLTARFRAQGGSVAFYRVAVAPFTELGGVAHEDNLGLLLAEMLSVELGQRPPFIVVERDRLSQIMQEHRLKDLGVLDEAGVAEFGKVLGAQSLMMGTVGEAGPQLLVTVRQVDVESGRAVVTSQVAIDRAGLVALSSDAVVLRSKSGSLFRSVVFPGWGQFYNDQPVKGTAFVVAGAGTLGTLAYFLSTGLAAKSKYESNRPETVGQRAIANERLTISNALIIAYGVVWALGALDAYLNGTDGTEVHTPEPHNASSKL